MRATRYERHISCEPLGVIAIPQLLLDDNVNAIVQGQADRSNDYKGYLSVLLRIITYLSRPSWMGPCNIDT